MRRNDGPVSWTLGRQDPVWVLLCPVSRAAAGRGKGVICAQIVGVAAHAESSVMEASEFLWTSMLFASVHFEMQGQLTELQHAIITHFYRTSLSEQ